MKIFSQNTFIFLRYFFCCVIFLGTSASAFAQQCTLPPGVVVNGANITGTVQLPVGGSQTMPINLSVLNSGVYPNNGTPCSVYVGTAALWQGMYAKFSAAGVTAANLTSLATSISGVAGAGVFVVPVFSACGYNAAGRTITCGPGTDDWTLETMAHENMHGWEFQKFGGRPATIQFYRAFADFANLVYTAYTAAPNTLQGPGWQLNYLTYGLQNEMEWGSEVFADWALKGVSRAVWPYIEANLPGYQAYFKCLWTTDSEVTDCARQLSIPIDFAASDPVANPPTVAGFTQAQSQSIWNVCFNAYRKTASAADFSTVTQLVLAIAPGLSDTASQYYKLAYADANHDGIMDWLCWYDGPGPVGVGNGHYLWNPQNKHGAYSFVVSGKHGDTYAQYTQDPYLTLPSMAGGAIAQPMFREWQGKYGSANGARLFAPLFANVWEYPIFSSKITTSPQLYLFGTHCASCAASVNTGAQTKCSCTTLGAANADNTVFAIAGLPQLVVNYNRYACSTNQSPAYAPRFPCDERPANPQNLNWLYADNVNGAFANISCNVPPSSGCAQVDQLRARLDELYRLYGTLDNRKGQGRKAQVKQQLVQLNAAIEAAKDMCGAK